MVGWLAGQLARLVVWRVCWFVSVLVGWFVG